VGGGTTPTVHQNMKERLTMEARMKTNWAVPGPWAKGLPPDAVHMSNKLVDPEPVQNTQNITCCSTQHELMGASLFCGHWQHLICSAKASHWTSDAHNAAKLVPYHPTAISGTKPGLPTEHTPQHRVPTLLWQCQTLPQP